MKRLNKEYKLDVCKHINLKYGSVNKDNPQVIYVSGKCWVSPKSKIDYKLVVDMAEREMRKNIKMFLTDGTNFCKRFILDFDLNADGMTVNGKKFLSFDFYLRQNEFNKKTLKELKEILERKVSTVVNSLVYSFFENDFTVEKRK
jgi:hypothetical protein